jgi:hypothetical protein
MYNGSFFKRMENFKTIQEMSGEYPRVDIQVIPDKFNDFTINSIAANYKPQAGLLSNFYKGISNDEKHYVSKILPIKQAEKEITLLNKMPKELDGILYFTENYEQ